MEFKFLSEQQKLQNRKAIVYRSAMELNGYLAHSELIPTTQSSLLLEDQEAFIRHALAILDLAMQQVIAIESESTKYVGPLRLKKNRALLTMYGDRLENIYKSSERYRSMQELIEALYYNSEYARGEIDENIDEIAQGIDEKITNLTRQHQLFALTVFVILLTMLVLPFSFLTKKLKKSFHYVKSLNVQLEQHRDAILKSQNNLLNVIAHLNEEKNIASNLNEQLLNKNSEMEQFIYTISHDLKSPLVTIGGFSRQLTNEISGDITEKQAHKLRRIEKNVKEMESLLADLLELSRVVQKAIDREPVDVMSVIKTELTLLEDLILAENANIKIHEPIGHIYANERLLSQCLANLFINAIHYRDQSRPLAIDIKFSKKMNYDVLTVADTGIGIEKKYHELVFRIFERLSTKKGDGTGVGLTIVKTVMEKHEGRVVLESELGVGSAFHLYFPPEKTEFDSNTQ